MTDCAGIFKEQATTSHMSCDEDSPDRAHLQHHRRLYNRVFTGQSRTHQSTQTEHSRSRRYLQGSKRSRLFFCLICCKVMVGLRSSMQLVINIIGTSAFKPNWRQSTSCPHNEMRGWRRSTRIFGSQYTKSPAATVSHIPDSSARSNSLPQPMC